nr:cholecystokinin receptor type A-like [Lytechinus pictus]
METQSPTAITDFAVYGSSVASLNDTTRSDWLWTPITWSYWISIQLVVACLGLGGNLLVLLVLFHRRSFKKPTDILIGGLAAADFITSIFMIPQPKLSGAPDTALGNVACKLVYSSIFLWISISSSVFTLTAIAIERYIAVIHPVKFKVWVTPKRLVYWFSAIWLLSFAINSRTFGTTWVDSTTGKCRVVYRHYSIQIVLGIVVFLIRFIFPAIIMLVCYYLITRSLRQRSKQFQPKTIGSVDLHLDQKRAGPSQSLLAARSKVIKIMFVVIITFIVCWAADSTGLLAYNVRLVDRSYLYSHLYHVFVIIAFFNTCANPLIYTISYQEFRLAVRDLFCGSGGVRGSLFGKDEAGNTEINSQNDATKKTVSSYI